MLLLRVLIVAGIVPAAAGPYISRTSALFCSSDPIHRVVLLDVSYSMGTREADQTRFQIAKERLAKIVNEAPAGSGFTLVTMGSTAGVIVAEPAFDRQQFLRLLDGIELSHGGADPLAAINAADLLVQKVKPSSNFSQHVITIASDLGENSWGTPRNHTGQGVAPATEPATGNRRCRGPVYRDRYRSNRSYCDRQSSGPSKSAHDRATNRVRGDHH